MKAVLKLSWRIRATPFISMVMVMVSACHSQESQGPTVQVATPVAASSSSAPAAQAWSVRLVITGGFAGEHREIAIDSAAGKAVLTNHKTGQRNEQALVGADHDQIAQLVRTLPKQLASQSTSNCNDCFNFDLDVSRDGVAQRVRLESFMLSDSVYGPLIEKLLTLSAGVAAQR